MIRSTLILILLVLNIYVAGQEPIDYSPKSLKRDLNKLDDSGFSIKELFPSLKPGEAGLIDGKFFLAQSDNKVAEVTYIYVGRVYSCRAGGCSTPGGAYKEGRSEYFDYYIFYDSSAAIRLVRVYNYQATHGYEVTAKGWLRQFEGFNGEQKLTVGNEIDAISGATISVYGITTNIEIVTGIIREEF